jgi:hypothetical protein
VLGASAFAAAQRVRVGFLAGFLELLLLLERQRWGDVLEVPLRRLDAHRRLDDAAEDHHGAPTR